MAASSQQADTTAAAVGTGLVQVTVLSMAGAQTSLRPLPSDATVRDLALEVRAKLSIPVSVQNLIHGTEKLSDPAASLAEALGGARSAELTVVRRDFTPQERAELHRRLVRAVAGGHVGQLRELIKEGALVNFQPEGNGPDTSVCLDHWPDKDVEDPRAAADSGREKKAKSRPTHMKVILRDEQDLHHDFENLVQEQCRQIDPEFDAEDAPHMQATVTDATGERRHFANWNAQYPEGPPADKYPLVFAWSVEQMRRSADERIQEQVLDDGSSEESHEGLGAARHAADPESDRGPCGGISPLLAALVVGDEDIARDLRLLGAKEPDMATVHGGLPEAFAHLDFPDVLRHIAAGADVNTRLRNGQGVNATQEGAPLHACCAQHRRPGAYEVAQVLIRKNADMSAKDTEGDNPMAHARYFHAMEIFELLKGCGARIEGPFFERFGR